VVAGPDETVCQVEKPEWVAVTPPWWADILMVPVWGPDPGPERILEEAVVAHINVRPADAVSPGAATASILHFTGNGMAAPLPPLGDAVARSRHRDAAIPAIVVLPTGSFHQTSAALQERLGSAEGLAGPLVVTEDYQGHWSRAFQPPEGPATYLVSAGGELVWQQQGPVDPASLGAALDEHATAGARRQSVLVRPGVRVGEPAPEALLEDGAAAELLGVRLGQGPVRLLFWKAWSHPCLAELRHLQRLHAGWAGGGPVILGIGDGEDARAVEEIARRHDLGFRLVADPDRRIARQFHINCWPTTLDIDGAGFVQSIHLGMTPEHGGAATVAAARRA
jgi:peroxiredoxin